MPSEFRSITEWITAQEWQAIPFIGLSATPWAKGLSKNYDDLLMPVSIQGLIDEGYLSQFRVFAPPAPDLTGVRTIAGEYNERDLSEACDKKEIIADVVRTWFEKGENRPTLCYAIDRKHAQHLQERFVQESAPNILIATPRFLSARKSSKGLDQGKQSLSATLQH